MKSFNFIIALITSLLCFASCAIRLYFQYNLLSLAVCAAIIFALPISSLLHELGHMLFGALVKIKAVPKFSVIGSSSCEIIPRTDKNLRRRLIFTASGGLTVNAVLIVVGVLALFSVIPVWLCVFMPSSVYLFVLNGVAAQLPHGKTDGLILCELVSNSDEAKVMLAVLSVQAQILMGKPIEKIDEKLLFDLPVIREDDPSFISLTELRYEYYKAKGDEEKASEYKNRLDGLKEYLI